MSMNTDFDRTASAWLADGPTELADRVLDAALREVHLTKQRRRWSAPWRTPLMSLRLSAALLAIVAIGSVIAMNLLGPSFGAPTPSATVQPSPTSTPNPLLDTAAWSTYVSKRYGYSIRHPADWSESPGTQDVTLDDVAWDSTSRDSFISAEGNVRVSAWSIAITPGIGLEAWFRDYCVQDIGDAASCAGFQQQGVAADMDGHAGLLFTSPVLQAFFLVDDRIYAVAIWRPEDDRDPSVMKYSGARRLLETYLSTMRLLPGGPARS
jgi:hypothetical protein